MSDAKVLDFVAKRKDSLEQKRRQFERVMFDSFLGCYSVIDAHGAIYATKLMDISPEGCLIQVPKQKNNKNVFKAESDLTLRLYFTTEAFIPAVVKIKNSRPYTDENGDEFVQYGCQFDKNVSSFTALESFIQFIYKFSEHSHVDKGERRVYFL
ncbi:MAG: PilZ domain-containing protein [Bacteriovoracaceae bacterium]|nr:PilZ domain-containing protein [Bacteriovoracaceae bacterium]